MATCIVFYHPGGPVRHRDSRGWTIQRHGRKFLQMPGEAVKSRNSRPQTYPNLYFWGEHEAPTVSTSLVVPKGAKDLPASVDQPLLPMPVARNGNLNTDPFVYCGPFRYSNCQQLSKTGAKRCTQTLTNGDLILFGSQLDGEFVLDTCLVVDSAMPLSSYRNGVLPGSLFDVMTLRLLPYLPYTVYEGACWSRRSPFSFVPCWDHLRNNNVGHPRPVLQPVGALSRVLNRRQNQGVKQSTILGLNQVFDEVVRQVLGQGCLLGTHLSHPHCGGSLPTSGRDRYTTAKPPRSGC
jgi:hypothetical protein